MDDSNPIPPSMNALLQELERAFQGCSLHANGTSGYALPSTDLPLAPAFDFSNNARFGFCWNDFTNGYPGYEAIFNGGYRVVLDTYGVISKALSKDGSVFLQSLLSSNISIMSDIIFCEVFEFIFDVMIDRHGNYVFQALIKSVDERQLQMIIEKLTVPYNYIYFATLHKYGIFSVKKLIIVLRLRESHLVTSVINSLSAEFGNLMTYPTGWYVIMLCLDVLDSWTNDSLYVRAMEECLILSRHKQGAVSLNGFIKRIKGPRRFQMLNLICEYARFLAHDPIGISVVQCVIGLGNPVINDQIFSLLDGYYVGLSVLKTGSRLVQQCLRTSAMDRVIHEFLRSHEFVAVAVDWYGHYVVQTALKESQDRNVDLHECLVVKIKQHLNFLQRGYGPHLLNFLKSIHCHL